MVLKILDVPGQLQFDFEGSTTKQGKMRGLRSGDGRQLRQLRSRREEFTRVAERATAGADVLPYKKGI